tara:strand:+ start:104 stop:1177 length:1074 start_codon:yes stop_codon:yes gene_type:complete
MMIELDGNYVEGGGSIARVALALSTLTGKPFKITNIRAGRKQPGLKAQHLTAVKALKEICQAQASDVYLGSKEFMFIPKKIKKGTYEIDIGTAGSITLLLQALLPPCLFAPGKITLKIKGGTSGKWSASVDYLQNILLPHLNKFVDKINFKILKRGYYPKGGGEVELTIHPKHLQDFYQNLNTIPKINLTEPGKLVQIKGIINCSKFLEKGKVAERIKQSAEITLRKLDCPTDIAVEYSDTLSPGGEIVLWARFSQGEEINFNNPVILGADARAEKGKKAEIVGQEAAQELIQEIKSGASVDKYLGDQLLMYMALLPGSKINVSEITDHCKTNMYVIEKFLDVGFVVKGKEVEVIKK